MRLRQIIWYLFCWGINKQSKKMNEELRIEKTRYTPYIHLKKGDIRFEGRSVVNDPVPLFQPVYDWIRNYVQNDPDKTRIDLKFEYINSSSTKWIFEILKFFQKDPKLLRETKVNWYYERGDEDMKELGEILRSALGPSLELIEIPEGT